MPPKVCQVGVLPTSKGLWPLIDVKRAVLALVQLKFISQSFSACGVVFCCCRNRSFLRGIYILTCWSERPSLPGPQYHCLETHKACSGTVLCVAQCVLRVWNFRHWVKHPYAGTRSEIGLEFIAVYKLIGLPLHFLRACLSLAKKKGIPGHTRDFTLFYHVDRTVYTITTFSCSQTYYRSRDLSVEDTERNNRVPLTKLTALPLDVKVVFIVVQTIFFVCFRVGTGSQTCKAAI